MFHLLWTRCLYVIFPLLRARNSGARIPVECGLDVLDQACCVFHCNVIRYSSVRFVIGMVHDKTPDLLILNCFSTCSYWLCHFWIWNCNSFCCNWPMHTVALIFVSGSQGDSTHKFCPFCCAWLKRLCVHDWIDHPLTVALRKTCFSLDFEHSFFTFEYEFNEHCISSRRRKRCANSIA